MNRRSFLGIAASATAKAASRRPNWPDSLTFTSSLDGTEQPFAIRVPGTYTDQRPWPLVVSLHGAGQTHRAGLNQVFGVEKDQPQPEVPAIVIAPYGRGSTGYLGIGELDVFEAIAETKKRFRVDEDRLYLTGVSMGGSGTFSIALARPDMWAAIAPVCGGAPAGSQELAGNALNLPVRIAHGDKDETVPVEVGRTWNRLLASAGVPVEYEEFPGIGHNVAPYAYRDGRVFSWLLRHRRTRLPRRVRFSTRTHRSARSSWLRLDAWTPGDLASADATIETTGRLVVRTANLNAFTVDLRPELHAAGELEVDGSRLRAPHQGIVSLCRTHGGWSLAEKAPYSGRTAELDGPISSVVSGRHGYVYGNEENAELAQHAANWAGRYAGPLVSFAVMSDATWQTRIRPNDAVVLFGTPETNRLLAQWQPHLPLRLNAAKVRDFGLLFMSRVGERLVLVSSGLPWWTGASSEQREGFRWQWLSLPYRLLWSFPEYIVFRGGITNIVASGYFDSFWRAKDERLDTLKREGVLASG
jgi:hypothetical protein